MTGTEKDCAGSVAGKEWKRTEVYGWNGEVSRSVL
jgi:hypothetical protein